MIRVLVKMMNLLMKQRCLLRMVHFEQRRTANDGARKVLASPWDSGSYCICLKSFFKDTTKEMSLLKSNVIKTQGFFQQFWENAPGQSWGKMIDLTSKLGEINNTEHNKGRKIYPQNQVILDCIMPGIPLKHKCLSIILIWIIVSHKQ